MIYKRGSKQCDLQANIFQNFSTNLPAEIDDGHRIINVFISNKEVKAAMKSGYQKLYPNKNKNGSAVGTLVFRFSDNVKGNIRDLTLYAGFCLFNCIIFDC